jgi:hypothetical protein
MKSAQLLIRGLSIWRDRLSINLQIIASFPVASFPTACSRVSGPPSRTFWTRGRSDFFLQSARHQMCTGTRFFSPQSHTISGLPSFAKSRPNKLGVDRASRNLRRSAWRVTGGGSVGSLPWVDARGCRAFQSAPVQVASRSRRTVYIARDPQFPPFPTQNGPTGFPRRPRRAAVEISRRQTPARTSRVTNRRVHSARFPFPASKPSPPVHDGRFANLTVKQSARFPLYGPDAIMADIFCAFQRVSTGSQSLPVTT